MNQEAMKSLVAEAVRDADLRAEEIPSIDLYMDQITSLVADKAQEGSPRHRDRVLTKTMINNYSKDGLISPIKGKKYDKEQILQMLLVYSMKNTLSIGEIKRVLQNVYSLDNYDETMLEEVYARFLKIKELQRDEAYDTLASLAKRWEFDLEDDADFFTFLLGLSSWSAYLKNMVQALLEDRYPDEEMLKKEIALQQKQKERRKRSRKRRQRRKKKPSRRKKRPRRRKRLSPKGMRRALP